MRFKISKELKSQITDSISQSTSHGLPQIVNTDNICLKITWVLFTIASFGLCVYLITDNVISYFKYEVSTKIRVKYESRIKFPSVTLCNLNGFTTEYAAEFKEKTLAGKNGTYNIKDDETYIKQNSLKLSPNEQKQLGDSAEKLFVQIWFDGFIYKTSFLNYYFSPYYGNCYTFNYYLKNDGTKREPFKTGKVGHLNGLYFSLNVSVNEKIDKEKKGAILFIHEFGSSPLSADPVIIPSGFEANIGLHRTYATLTPKPFSNCEKDTDDPTKFKSDLMNELYKSSYNYSQKICIDLCSHKFLLEKCKCYMYFLTVFNEGEPCVSESQNKCVGKNYENFISSNYIDEICLPKCPLECKSLKYAQSTSMAKIEYERNEDRAAVGVFYEDFSFTDIEENEVVTPLTLISNIGGIAGLFMGVSFLSFVEILAIFIDVLMLYIKKHRLEKRLKFKNKESNEKPDMQLEAVQISKF